MIATTPRGTATRTWRDPALRRLRLERAGGPSRPSVATDRQGSAAAVFAPFAPQTRHFIARYVPSDRNARIVDLGCGDGLLLHFLLEAGYRQVSGIDVSSEQIARAHALGLFEARRGDIDSCLASAGDQSLDVVLLIDVLEHLTRDQLFAVLDSVARVLRPGGVSIAHVPNAEGLYGMRVRYGDLTHEQAFTARSMSQAFAAVGFQSIRRVRGSAGRARRAQPGPACAVGRRHAPASGAACRRDRHMGLDPLPEPGGQGGEMNVEATATSVVSAMPAPTIIETIQLGSEWISESAGGLSRYYSELVQELPKLGVGVRGLVVGSKRVATETGGAVHPFAPLGSSLPTRLAGVRASVRRAFAECPDALFVSHFPLYAAPCLDLQRGRPLAVTSRDHGPRKAESRETAAWPRARSTGPNRRFTSAPRG
jgi:2-polyprenyl-3-methyl-5-hydroxy-6-metoxy-1,4-benzoquinol methylase